MATPTEKILTEVLDAWALKGHGLALQQINTLLFMQLLRETGFEIVRASDLQKIRYQQKSFKFEINNILKQVTAMQMRVEALDKLELIQEIPLEKADPKEEVKPPAKPKKTQV